MNKVEYEKICNYIWNMKRETEITFNRDKKINGLLHPKN